jgi:putative ATPase
VDLFDYVDNSSIKPLAERMRPKTLDDFVGQQHLLSQGSLLRRAILADNLGSCIFFGPPGTGKTSLANIIAETTNSPFIKLNAVSSGVADAKKVIEDARNNFRIHGKKTYLFLDECHRWSKAQSDSVLAAIEQGTIVFIGGTTENPYVSLTKALVSRCRVFEFKKLKGEDIYGALQRAVEDKKFGLGNYDLLVVKQAYDHFVWGSDGDLRTALNALELAAVTTPANKDGKIVIDQAAAENSIQKKALSVDENMYYDMISAFIKSMRGSDADAALYWAERLLAAGADPMLILRRVLIHASEDVGMADPQALVVAAAAMTAFQNLGMPEGKIPMFQAIIHISTAPKSNSVVTAMGAVEQAVPMYKDDVVPMYLRDQAYLPNKRKENFERDKGKEYLYPHDFGGWVEQQYLPDTLKDMRFYVPTKNGFEGGRRLNNP